MAETDQILLKRFAKGDEKAFRIFVERHFGLVFQVALRRIQNRQLAEEAAQNVFCAVAKKASGLSKKSDLLLPWLHRATLFESSKAMRSEQSSQRRKKLNHPDDIPSTAEQENTAWLLALPHLDEALDRLSTSDRKVVLQHYFEGQSFPAIAKQEGRPAGTIQKQCRRALDKLARILHGRGITISSITIAGGLTPKLTQAASTHLVSTIASQAITGASLHSHSTTSLSIFMLMKSKYTLPLILFTVLLPIGAQQIIISQETLKNRDLKRPLVSTTPTKTNPRSATTNRTSNRISTGVITLEAIQSSQFEAKRLGTLKHIEFEKLIASLSQEDLLRLIPQALDISNQDNRLDLSQVLINALATLEPEATVRLVSNHYPENPFQLNLGVERALSLWTKKDPEAAVDWLRIQSQTLSGVTYRDFRWSGLNGFQAAALSQLIESRSPLARDVFSLNPVYAKYYLIQDAAEPRGHRVTGPLPTLSERADRVEAFLPWIREFGTDKPSRTSQGNRGELLETVLRESSSFWDDSLPALATELLTRGSLKTAETNTIVHYVAKNILDKHFNSDSSLSWAEHQAEARNWVNTHAPEQSETLLAEAQSLALKHERFQIEHKIERIEQQNEISSARDFLQIDFQLFPDFLERAQQQAARISDPEERSKVEAHLSQ